jgi:hypothetical protein
MIAHTIRQHSGKRQPCDREFDWPERTLLGRVTGEFSLPQNICSAIGDQVPALEQKLPKVALIFVGIAGPGC